MMFGSEILDVAAGLALVFLMLSLVASAVREAIEGILKARAVHLERGIRELLGDAKGEGLARRLYEHPLVGSLFLGTYKAKETRFVGGAMPTYIPSRNFAVALIDLIRNRDKNGPYTALQWQPVLSTGELRASALRIESSNVRRAVVSAIDPAQNDLERVRANIEAWFDSAMERVSGRYKRRTQLWLFVIGFALTLSMNVNAITIASLRRARSSGTKTSRRWICRSDGSARSGHRRGALRSTCYGAAVAAAMSNPFVCQFGVSSHAAGLARLGESSPYTCRPA